MFTTRQNGLFAAVAALGLLAPVAAHAQCATGTTTKMHRPLFEKHYIKKFSGPTICPGSCYGYFPTKWSRWEDNCPGGVGCDTPIVVEPGTPAAIPTTPPATPLETAPKPVDPKPMPPVVVPDKPTTPDKPAANTAPNNIPSSVIPLQIPQVKVLYPVVPTPRPIVAPPLTGKSS